MKKKSRSEVPGGHLLLMACMERVLGTISMREVRLLVTSTSNGRNHSGILASCSTDSFARCAAQAKDKPPEMSSLTFHETHNNHVQHWPRPHL